MKSSAILRKLLVTLALLAKTSTALATITVTGLTNQTRYNDSVTFTIAAEAGFTTTANVDGTSVAIGSPVTISSVRYHELAVQKQPTAGGAVETALLKFIVRNSARITTEDGIPSFTPPPLVDDAPSAITAGTLTVVAPASFPAGLPIPVAAYLRNSSGQPLWLNGNVQSANFPGQPLRLIRGWGSAFLPAATTAGTLHYDATLAGHTTDKSISIEGQSHLDRQDRHHRHAGLGQQRTDSSQRRFDDLTRISAHHWRRHRGALGCRSGNCGQWRCH